MRKIDNYYIREATIDDCPFLADVIIGAEKGGTSKLSYSTVFDLAEDEVKKLLVSILRQGIPGSELYYKNYFIIEMMNTNAAAFGSWIECYNNELPSSILKSNLLFRMMKDHNLNYFRKKYQIIKDLVVYREENVMQLEYLYVAKKFRGFGLASKLINHIEKQALKKYPTLRKIQLQVFSNNTKAINLYKKNNFKITKTYISNNNEIYDYLPFNEKYIMEKTLN